VYGVWFEQWRAVEVFLVYCLESVIIGGFNVIKMFLTTLVKKKDVWENKGSSSTVSGYFFIFFFIIHYGFFIAVQMGIFLATINMGDLPNTPDGILDFLLHFPKYLSVGVTWLLLTFIISYAFQTLKDFVISGEYKTASIGRLMFQPYPRIIVQQFVVILGGFILMLGAGKLFIVIFALVKIFFEVMLDYDKMLKERDTVSAE